MYQAWRFMTPWCKAMNAMFNMTGSKPILWCWGPDIHPAVRFSIAPSTLRYSAEVQLLCEGVGLFAAIAQTDPKAFVHLMQAFMPQQKCLILPVAPDKDMLPVSVEVDMTKCANFSWMEELLTTLCCRLVSKNTSTMFQETWGKIEKMCSRSQLQTLMGVAVPVCLVINKHEQSYALEAALSHAWSIIKDQLPAGQIRWQDPVASRVKNSGHDFYASFAVDSIKTNSTLEGNGLGMSKEFMRLIDEMCGHVRFSTLGFSLVNRQRAQDLYRMTTGLLCRQICLTPSDVERQIENDITMKLRDGFEWQFMALCSALAVTRSCRSVNFSLHVYGPDAIKVWQWLAYAFFSKTARSRSTVKEIMLSQVSLTTDRAEAMETILRSNNSEQELFKCEHQCSLSVLPDTREFRVKEDAVVEVRETVCRRTKTMKSADVFRGRDIGCVKLVGDNDGMSEWIDALVPGIGLCKIQRCNLTPHEDHKNVGKPEVGLNLALRFLSREPDSWHGLPRLLDLVGFSLQSLKLDCLGYDHANRPIDDFSWIVGACPHLVELIIKFRVVGAESFVSACEHYRSKLQRLECEFDDIGPLSVVLASSSSSLARHLRRWYCCFQLRMTSHDEVLPALHNMLSANRTLSCLILDINRGRVDIFRSELKRYNLSQLNFVGEELPLKSKLAFLSVFGTTKSIAKPALCDCRRHRPDDHVISMIFEYAATRAIRKVMFV